MKELLKERNVLVQAIEKKQWDEVVRLASPELVNTYDANGSTPLMRAAYSAPEEVLTKIIENASEECVKHKDDFGSTILHHLSLFSRSSALRRVLAVNSDNVNAREDRGRTPLHECLNAERRSSEEQRETAKILMELGAMPTIQDNDGRTPIDDYKRNPCREYDENLKDEQKKELLKILEGGRVIPVEILARGSDALNAYFEALKEGETEVNQGRTIIMGLERVGKTSTIRSFLKKEFNPDEPITDAIATIKMCIQDSLDDWNEAAEDKSPVTIIYEDKVAESIAEKLLKKPKGSTQLPEYHQKETEKRTQESSQPSTSTGQSDNVPENIAKKAEQKLKFSQTTGKWKTPENEFIMNIWDFGGQPIYNVIQRIYIPSFAVVCVVFNLEHDLDHYAEVRDPTTGELYKHRMTYLDYILYFIRSVYMNCSHYELDGILGPPVLLIGTHCHSSKLGNSPEERELETKKKFSKIREALVDKPYEKMVSLTNFTIENSAPFDKSGAANIMAEVMKFSKKLVRRLPFKWLLVQQEIQQLKKKQVCLETSEIMKLLERCGVQQDGEVLLQYLHDTGELLFYPNDRDLKNIIVIDLMYVVNLSKSFITVVEPEHLKPLFNQHRRYLDSGILKEDFLIQLWSQFCLPDDKFNFFVSLLQQFGLICERKVTKGESRVFYVLARLKPEPTASSDVNYGNRAISLFHDFDNYLPDDVFQRTVTKFIDKFQMDDDTPELSYDHVGLNIDEKHYVVLSVATIEQRRMFKTTIIRTETREPKPNVCKKVLSFLKTELKVFCPSDAQGIEVKLNIPCDCCTKNHWHAVEDFNKDELPCGLKRMDVTRYRRLFGRGIPMPIKVIQWFHRIFESRRARQMSHLTGTSSHPADRTFITNHKFRSFLVKLSDEYLGENYRWLRFLLSDVLPNSILSKRNVGGMYLFNELAKRGRISPNNITILSDISKVTEMEEAKQCVEAYKQETECKEGNGLTAFRKNLFKGLLDVEDSEVHRLAAFYRLSEFKLDNIWDLLYELENNKILANRDEWEYFASLLNKTAKNEVLEALTSINEQPTKTTDGINEED